MAVGCVQRLSDPLAPRALAGAALLGEAGRQLIAANSRLLQLRHRVGAPLVGGRCGCGSLLDHLAVPPSATPAEPAQANASTQSVGRLSFEVRTRLVDHLDPVDCALSTLQVDCSCLGASADLRARLNIIRIGATGVNDLQVQHLDIVATRLQLDRLEFALAAPDLIVSRSLPMN